MARGVAGIDRAVVVGEQEALERNLADAELRARLDRLLAAGRGLGVEVEFEQRPVGVVVLGEHRRRGERPVLVWPLDRPQLEPHHGGCERCDGDSPEWTRPRRSFEGCRVVPAEKRTPARHPPSLHRHGRVLALRNP